MKLDYPMFFCFLSFLLFSCQYQPKKITINGNIKEYTGEKVYVKQVDAFAYNNNTLLDSAIVNENGDFQFIIENASPLLLSLSKNNRQHPVHKVLQDHPEYYYYGYCAMFYIPEPTAFINESSIIGLDWSVKNQLDSFSFKCADSENFRKFYNYYRQERLGKDLYQENGKFKEMEMEAAWNIIEHAVNELMSKYGVLQNKSDIDNNSYLYTEINLGGANQFLNWLEHINEDKLDDAFKRDALPELYLRTFDRFANNDWNAQSVEFFKMTERYITFNLNKSYRKFQNYYPLDKEKMELVKKILPASVAERYVSNF